MELLSVALQKKRAKVAEIEYWNKVKNPPPPPKFNSQQLIEFCKRKFMETYSHEFIIDDMNEKVITLLANYFTSDSEFEKEGHKLSKGLLLQGNVGCGKTTIMKFFASNPVASYFVISVRKVASDFVNGGDHGKGGYDAIEKYFGLYSPVFNNNPFKHETFGICFDDLGTETNKKSFGNESNVMAEILLNRYDYVSQLRNKTHLTTNLTAEQVEEVYGLRVRSRMREMFNIIEFGNSPDRRI